MTRKEVLEKAEGCVCKNREDEYGSPEDSFGVIAKMWEGYLSGTLQQPEVVIERKDVAAMLALLKIARIACGIFHADNWVDLAGYAACGGELEAPDMKKN